MEISNKKNFSPKIKLNLAKNKNLDLKTFQLIKSEVQFLHLHRKTDEELTSKSDQPLVQKTLQLFSFQITAKLVGKIQ
jgi:3-keto-L-gulonate-6-phosphate decarboxylase